MSTIEYITKPKICNFHKGYPQPNAYNLYDLHLEPKFKCISFYVLYMSMEKINGLNEIFDCLSNDI